MGQGDCLRPRCPRARDTGNLIAFGVGEAILARQHIDIAFSHPGVARAVFGAALYLTVVGLFGLAIGGIVRNTAGGIAAFAGILSCSRHS